MGGGVHTRGPTCPRRAHFLGCWCHQETRAQGGQEARCWPGVASGTARAQRGDDVHVGERGGGWLREGRGATSATSPPGAGVSHLLPSLGRTHSALALATAEELKETQEEEVRGPCSPWCKEARGFVLAAPKAVPGRRLDKLPETLSSVSRCPAAWSLLCPQGPRRVTQGGALIDVRCRQVWGDCQSSEQWIPFKGREVRGGGKQQ